MIHPHNIQLILIQIKTRKKKRTQIGESLKKRVEGEKTDGALFFF